MIPNVTVVKVEGTIQAFPMTGNGRLINPSLPLTSDLELEEYEVIFGVFDERNGTLDEMARFILETDGNMTPAIEVMRANELVGFCKNVMTAFNKHGKFDNVMEV